jgi:GT2 family glycosyltransferase
VRRVAGSNPRVSVLVVSWNTRELTAACLDSLPVAVDEGTTFETIVVDNGSIDGSVEMLRARADVQLVENRENRGFAAAVNQAYARSRGELVLLLNSDIEFKPAGLSSLVRFLDAHAEAAGVGPRYLNPDGSPQDFHFRFPTFGMLVANTNALFRSLPGFARRDRSYRMLDDDFSAPVRVEQPSASCLLLRRSVLPDGHVLDEEFPIYFNDVELAWRLAQAGRQLWVTPEVEVFHVHGASTRLVADLRRQHLASLIRYLRRTQPRSRVLAFQTVVLLQKGLMLLARRPGALPRRELLRALRGEPGPLPQAPRS